MSATSENKGIPVEALVLYDGLIETIPNLERKGASMLYTSLNGHMFSFLASDGSLGIRLPRQAREDFLQKYNARLCEAHGTVLKEYVAGPDELFSNTQELKEIFLTSYKYVKTLKPKPQKK